MRSARLLACASTSVALVAAVTLTVDQAAAAPGGGAGPSATTTVPASDTSPQPFSNADSQNTGANDTSGTNQYRSTRNGSPSQNGSGNGTATGEPCAGCVGKADNKNPPGQFPNGSDANSGYECDANQGIGKSNPAHTGCIPSTTTTTGAQGPTTTTTSTTPGGSGGDTGPTSSGEPPPSGGTGTASSQTVETALQTWITHASATRPAGPATAAASGAGSLAFTGANLARDALLGAASLLLAAILYLVDSRLRRRRLAPPLP